MEPAACHRFYRVVVNADGCYSIWPTELDVPEGWTATGFSGPREAALNQVAELWRANRPDPTATDGSTP